MDLTYSDKSHSYKELRFNNLEYGNGRRVQNHVDAGRTQEREVKGS